MRTLFSLLAWALLTAGAHAKADPDETARTALAQRRFDTVIAVYAAPLAEGQVLRDVAYYRLAIAHNALDQPMEAWRNLQAALGQNNAGTFASSPARLAALSEAIQAGCERLGHAKCATSPDSTIPASTLSAAAPSLAAAEAAASAIPVSATATAVTASEPIPLVQTTRAPVAMPQLGETAPAPFWTGSIIVALQGLAILMLAWMCWRMHNRVRRTPAGREGIERLRDDTAVMVRNLGDSAEGRATELFAHLCNLLPHLEREAGRVTNRALNRPGALDARDRKTRDLVQHLTQVAPDALRSSALDIEAMFRRPLL